MTFFVRCAVLNTPEKIFVADVYCHSSCYVSNTKASNPKYELSMKAVRHLDPLAQDGYGLTVTEVK